MQESQGGVSVTKVGTSASDLSTLEPEGTNSAPEVTTSASEETTSSSQARGGVGGGVPSIGKKFYILSLFGGRPLNSLSLLNIPLA